MSLKLVEELQTHIRLPTNISTWMCSGHLKFKTPGTKGLKLGASWLSPVPGKGSSILLTAQGSKQGRKHTQKLGHRGQWRRETQASSLCFFLLDSFLCLDLTELQFHRFAD